MPDDATHLINDTYYKIGRHGLPFRWNGEEWLKTAFAAEWVKGYDSIEEQQRNRKRRWYIR